MNYVRWERLDVTLTMYARQLADKTLMNYTRWGKAGCNINNACEAVSRSDINKLNETGKGPDVASMMHVRQSATG